MGDPRVRWDHVFLDKIVTEDEMGTLQTQRKAEGGTEKPGQNSVQVDRL